MAGFQSASTKMKVALVAVCLAVLLFVIGFSTVAWMSNYYGSSYGLWNTLICGNRGCREYPATGYPADFYRASQAMETIGLIALLVGALLLILYIFVASIERRNIQMAFTILLFIAVAFILIGVIIFSTKMEKLGFSIDWSNGLAICGAILAFIAALMGALELCGK